MERILQSRTLRFLLAALAGAAFGGVLAYAVTNYLHQVRQATLGRSSSVVSKAAPIQGGYAQIPAWRYARALADGDMNTAIEMTSWMRERLAFRRTETGDEAEVAKTREELAASLADRSVEGNRLTPEGVEDQYLFTPGVQLEIAGELPGDEDLEAPSARKTLIRVVFPREETALRETDGRAIRELIAGLNTSPDGLVLKSGIVGNADILRDTIQYDWP